MPNVLIDEKELQLKLLKAFDLEGGPDVFIKNYNANPDNYKQYHDNIRILKALVNEQPKLIHPEIIQFLNQMRLPPNPLSFRTDFIQAGLKREAILSKMTLPELEKLRDDFNEDLQKAKEDDKLKQIYPQLISQINKTINERKAAEKQAAPEPKKSSLFNLFSKKHDKEHGDKKSFGQKMKDIKNKMPTMPFGRRKG